MRLEKTDVTICFRISSSDNEVIEKMAYANRMPKSQYIRHILNVYMVKNKLRERCNHDKKAPINN